MPHTKLSLLLLKLFAKGELAGTTVHDLAAAAWEDGWGRGDTLARKLVMAGNGGTKRSRIMDDVVKAAISEGLVSSPARPYRVPLGTGGELIVFLPHEFYPGIVGDDLEHWCLSPADVQAGVGLAGLLKTWSEHADVDFNGDLSKVGVLGLHADGVQYSASVRAGGARSIVVGSMNIISAASAERKHRRQPLFVLRKSRFCNCGCQGFDTVQEIMAVVAWSVACLATGVSPTCRHDGAPWTGKDLEDRIPGGKSIPRAALLQVRGDWEFFEQFFRTRSVNSDNFCWMCQTTQRTLGPLHFSDFRPTAPHRQTLISTEQYLLACVQEGSQPSHLFRCPGFQLDFLVVDVMHAGDLGTFQDAIGSLFWLEVNNKTWYRSKKVGLAALNSNLDFFYAANQDRGFSKLTPLVITQILARDPGYPFLKAKAAQTRHAVQFCLALAHRHRAGDTDHTPFVFGHNHRLANRSQQHLDLLVQLFEGLNGFVVSCSSSPFNIRQCRQSMYDYLLALGGLNALWREGLAIADHRTEPFHLRPKAHACQHLAEEKIEVYGSPSSFWCYRDEDFIGVVKGIASKTKHPFTLEERIVQKLCIWAAVADC
jgi:hypothetical protein